MPAVENDSDDPVVRLCRSQFGITYPYPWQRLIIAAVLDAVVPDPHDLPDVPVDLDLFKTVVPDQLRRIAVLPTGAGKSLCWMLPAAVITGITVAVFPLLSLMSDQERRLKNAGISSVTLRGGQGKSERRSIWEELERGKTRIVLANPEVLQTGSVGARLGALKPAFLVVDETHTVSQWGESFRPACAGMGRLVREWNPPAVLALTATAGPHIRDRITELLFNGETPTEALADPDRPAIRYGVIPALSRNHCLERLVRTEPRPLVVFGPTRSSVAMAARMLRYRLKDDQIRYYHAGLTREEKVRLEGWFLESDGGVLCATCAYGMGVDKSNVRTVVHLAPPGSVEAYLQESGRAARDGGNANAWLICTPEDTLDTDNLRGGATGNGRAHRSVEAAIEGDSGGAPLPSRPDAETVAHARRSAIIRYAASADRCRREMLLEALGIEARDCTGCDVCGGEAWTVAPEEKVILQVTHWNRGRFRKGQLARVLIGCRTAEVRRTGLDHVRGFGTLGGWELEDAEEAINILVRTGNLKHRRYGPPGRLYSVKAPQRRKTN